MREILRRGLWIECVRSGTGRCFRGRNSHTVLWEFAAKLEQSLAQTWLELRPGGLGWKANYSLLILGPHVP